MISISHLLESSKVIQRILIDIKDGRREFYFSGAKGSLSALLASVLVKSINWQQTIIVAPDNAELEKIAQDFISFSGIANILKFPGPEFFTEDNYSFDDYTRLKRYETLSALYQDAKQIIFTTPDALTIPIPDIEKLVSQNIFLKINMNITPAKLVENLFTSGYEEENSVDKKGTFSRRGGIIDVFPVGVDYPVRIEFFADEIYSLRLFDIETQRSYEKISEIEIHPFGDPESNQSIFSYFQENSAVFWYEPEDDTDEASKEERISVYKKIKKSFKSKNWIEISENWLNKTEEKNIIKFSSMQIISFQTIDVFISELKKYESRDMIVFILCDNKGQQDRLLEIFDEKQVRFSSLSVQIGSISNGFEFLDGHIVVIKDDEIFGRYEAKKKPVKFKKGVSLTSFHELKETDYIVHVNHGIGKYLGIDRISVEGKEQDFIKIMYDDNAKIFVPITQLNLVQKYIGDPDNPPPLNKLGTSAWASSKERVKKATEKIAMELVELYAAREALAGHAYQQDSPWQKEFENAFIYELTPDQQNAVKEVKQDMEKAKPMDRLICGDVGYGKTEVAIRASFKAVMEGKQVAVLVPTTILAEQHFRTFSDRMADYPVKINVLSRFVTKKEQNEIIEKLPQGKIDIVIATHRLIQDDVKFKNLGLLVIDEEHRFGVNHKEKLKKMRQLVDVLSLTATPIPRTMHMSLVEVRDMSIIATPPPGRIPIQTFVLEVNDNVVKEAITRELKRGGQVFFVHNRVETIERAGRYIKQLLPEIKIAIGHGQMSGPELEKIMMDFMDKKYDVLVCTTIIESGLDIPNANTIIIEHANKLGLAQLYQLKGRVGRCDRMAYAYLLYDKDEKLSRTAGKRLEAIAEITDLGAGFKIAMRDLEIRGAGNMLGTSQHGHINSVGYDLYCDLLKESIEKLRGNPKEEKINTEIILKISGYIPSKYISDSSQKISIYKKMASCENIEELEDIIKELKDRFGEIPLPVINLLELINIKILAAKAFIVAIRELDTSKISIRFLSKNSLKPDKIMLVCSKYLKIVNFISGQTPEFIVNIDKSINDNDKLVLLKNILKLII